MKRAARGEGSGFRCVEVGDNPPGAAWGGGWVDVVVVLDGLGGENSDPPTPLVRVHWGAGDVDPFELCVHCGQGAIAPVVCLLNNNNVVVGKEVFDKFHHTLETAPSSPCLVDAAA